MNETHWHGTDIERSALLLALTRNCLCQYDTARLRTSTCPGHEALLRDQRFLDGLLEMRHYGGTLNDQEFDPSCQPPRS